MMDTFQGEIEHTPLQSYSNYRTQASANEEENEQDKDVVMGRWTKIEQKLFLEALQKYGKNWEKVHQHVGTRTTTQVRSHAQKYFQKTGKTGNTENESSEYAKIDISQGSIKIEPKPEIILKPIYTPYHKDNANRLAHRIKRIKDKLRTKKVTLLEYSTKLEICKRKKEECPNILSLEENESKIENEVGSEEIDNFGKINTSCPVSFLQNKNDLLPFQQEQLSEPNFENFKMEFEKPLELVERKRGVNQEVQTNEEENFQFTILETFSINNGLSFIGT
jgi:SHAQKYF class myb-like DNA-binding protein